jgi:hypothetical protein
MNPNIRRKIGAWALFLGFFLFLSLGATSYWKIADLAYMFLGLAAMAVISLLAVWGKWRSVLMNPPDDYTHSTPEVRDKFLRAVRRWCGGK